MANNFKPWVDSPTAGQQVQSASVFTTDAQRVNGFKAGDPASALRVNSALRQANIVVAGLMQMCDDIKTLPDGLSLMSTVTQVKNAIKAAIDQLDATVLASAKSYTDTRETVIDGKITNVQSQVTSNKNELDALESRVDDLSNCYSEANPPPYPVVSVNGQTGAVTTNDIPAGGTTGQVLTKASDTDYDVGWTTPSEGTVVEANPVDEATVELEKLKVGTVTYSIPSGGAQILTATVKTSTEWGSQNPVLAAGEFGYDTTNKITKIGDGSTPWNALPAFSTTRFTFATAAWSDISRITATGDAQKYFNVGDEKTVELSTGEVITLVILGFNHDYLTSGGKAGITIGMKNLLARRYRMNASSTNAGGWDESEMRTETMQTLLSQLPSDLQAVIKSVNKKATSGSKSTTITTSSDKLFLFSEVELNGTKVPEIASEGEQYEYWKTVKDGKTNADKIKYLSNGGGSAEYWWLRSPTLRNIYTFKYITPTGGFSYPSSSTYYGVSFGFCV